MEDLNKLLRKSGNRKIVNREIIELEDRNIDSIIINCYSNLQQCKLAAYTITYADSSMEFQCEFKAQLDKLRSKYKDKLLKCSIDDQRTEVQKMLNLHNTAESINVQGLHNNYQIITLKYFIDPMDTINKSLVLPAVEATLENYFSTVNDYDHKLDESYQYLKLLQKEYTRLRDTGEVIPDYSGDKLDLFVKDQLVLCPVYENDAKYTIDGLKYYGTFNNTDTGVITKTGMFGFKAFKNGKIFTMYLLCKDDVLFIKSFGTEYNLFHLVTQKNATDITWEEARDTIFPRTDNKKIEQLFYNTYEHARLVELKDPRILSYEIHAILPDPTRDNNGRATLSDSSYVKQIFAAVEDFIYLQDHNNRTTEQDRQYEFLGALEIEIYNEINGRKISKNTDINSAKNRINLSPMSIIKVIKKGNADNSNALYVSTSTEPNPFDMFYVFGYMKKTINTDTKANRNKAGNKTREEDKWLKYDDQRFLGEFCPKSEKNIGRATTLRVGIDSMHITRRRPLS